jgi:hypothetical protein
MAPLHARRSAPPLERVSSERDPPASPHSAPHWCDRQGAVTGEVQHQRPHEVAHLSLYPRRDRGGSAVSLDVDIGDMGGATEIILAQCWRLGTALYLQLSVDGGRKEGAHITVGSAQ